MAALEKLQTTDVLPMHFMSRLLTVSAVLLMACAPRAGSTSPSVEIRYSRLWDATCSSVRGPRIRKAWADELSVRLPEFVRLWNVSGPRSLTLASSLIGKPFPKSSFQARLTLCNVPSNSRIGTMVNMRHALMSFSHSAVPLRYKTNVLFHEVLHDLIGANPPRDSPLLRAHAMEDSRVRSHLHLLALQKAVLLKMGRRSELEEVMKFDSQLPGGYYRRAWELVNETDATYLGYVAELR